MKRKPDWETILPVKGVRLGTAAAGIKYAERDDLLVIELAEGSKAAGVFTQNAFCAAPVLVAKKHLENNPARYFVVNSGNANACTGQEGLDSALAVCDELAMLTGVTGQAVIPFSTGVIGEQLSAEKINAALPFAIKMLSESSWKQAAQAIMTTDTVPKAETRCLKWQGEQITVTGIAKGAGMIRPNMATMLAYIFTDANVSKDIIQKISKDCAERSFNRISIDGDTSTNDSCMLVATCQCENEILARDDSAFYEKLRDAILEVYQSLAKSIVYDGEGATKCVEVIVEQGAHSDECLNVAYSIAHSPLVKTAFFASDPNWGRIVAAIGYANIDGLDSRLVDVWVDQVKIVAKGERAPEYTESLGQNVFNQAEFCIRVNLNRGKASESIWTTDLSHEYVRINAEYRS